MATSDLVESFKFELSLSVLNHLGRNLYRNFITVVGEAISNSWDADANNVWIEISADKSMFAIKDDGIGMDDADFSRKFLRVGYSKRKGGSTESDSGRPFIGAKGIGKLALLSCSERVSIFTKKKDHEYIGGTIDNTDLDVAITHDLTPDQYELEELDFDLIEKLQEDHEQGTILVFEGMKENIKHSSDYLRKLIALSFRFSLFDDEFAIFVNDQEVSIEDLKGLRDHTEFLWNINTHQDEYLNTLEKLEADPIPISTRLPISGFLATVSMPRYMKVSGTDERASVDLFVNGRLREKNVLSHVTKNRIVENYLYGQIHFDEMDTGTEDPFTSSREGILEDDENFQQLLKFLDGEALTKIIDEWDRLRLSRNKPGDDDNPRLTPRSRAIKRAIDETLDEYSDDNDPSEHPEIVRWHNELRNDGQFNVDSYLHCFISENLVRAYIEEYQMPIVEKIQDRIDTFRDLEETRKTEANISIDIRRSERGLDWLGMDDLSSIVEQCTRTPQTRKRKSLKFDALVYRPLRNVVCHTGLLTQHAKNLLEHEFQNIKARVNHLIRSQSDPT